MLGHLESRYQQLPVGQRWLLAWGLIGACVHACLPALHHADSTFGLVGLWLWLLPLAALAMDLLWTPRAPTPALVSPRRRRVSATGRGLNRRIRPRLSPRPSARSSHPTG